MSHSHGQQHLKIRKRIHQKFQQFPHPDRMIRGYDRFVTILGCLNPIFVIPQLIMIFKTQSSESVSIIPWLYFTVVCAAWMIYGLIHRDRSVFYVNLVCLLAKIPLLAAIVIFS